MWVIILSYFWLQSSSFSPREIPSSISLPSVCKFHVPLAQPWHGASPAERQVPVFWYQPLGVIRISLALAKTTEPSFTNYIFPLETFVPWKQCWHRDSWEITGSEEGPIAMRLVMCISSVPAQGSTASALVLHGTLKSLPSQREYGAFVAQ